jgi:hypothetical protein
MAAPIGPMAPSTRLPAPPAALHRGGRPAGLPAGLPDDDWDGQPLDGRQVPTELDRLGDTEARAAKAATVFRQRFSSRWSK